MLSCDVSVSVAVAGAECLVGLLLLLLARKLAAALRWP
jgi:hypothetical protein